MKAGDFCFFLLCVACALNTAVTISRTLVVPPLLHHREVEYGSCEIGTVKSPSAVRFIESHWVVSLNFKPCHCYFLFQLRAKLWKVITRKVLESSYLSIADVVDLSNIPRGEQLWFSFSF